MVEALAAQRLYWEPGTDHGYHDLTFGWGVGEFLRRSTGKLVDELFQDEFREPLGAEVRIGIGDLTRFAPFRQPRPAGRHVPRVGRSTRAAARSPRRRSTRWTSWRISTSTSTSPISRSSSAAAGPTSGPGRRPVLTGATRRSPPRPAHGDLLRRVPLPPGSDGARIGIEPEGGTAFTGCVAFGLERWVSVLVVRYGSAGRAHEKVEQALRERQLV